MYQQRLQPQQIVPVSYDSPKMQQFIQQPQPQMQSPTLRGQPTHTPEKPPGGYTLYSVLFKSAFKGLRLIGSSNLQPTYVESQEQIEHSFGLQPAIVYQLVLNSQMKQTLIVLLLIWSIGSKLALTWVQLRRDTSLGKKNTYADLGGDATSNPYVGDTDVNSKLPVLCVYKDPSLTQPSFVAPQLTPGGATSHSFCFCHAAVTAPVKGTKLSTPGSGDTRCQNQFGPLYRMAEFHDGDPSVWAGWTFWAHLNNPNSGNWNSRMWVSINDQPANPWS